MQWHITAAFCVGRSDNRGEYSVLLEGPDGARAAAGLDVWSSRAGDASFDPAVQVLHCSSDAAREWLSAPEHEYFIAEQLLLRRAA
jgi:hypothetical protein